MEKDQEVRATPLDVIARTAHIVLGSVDRIVGGRQQYPVILNFALQYCLKKFGVDSRIMYGKAAWLEVLENGSLIWAGHFGDKPHFWLQTEYAETVDLHLGVAYLQDSGVHLKSRYSPPNLWTRELPNFCKYAPQGVAEFDPPEGKFSEWITAIFSQIDRSIETKDADFPNEAFLCPNRKVLDNSESRFRYYDRALSVQTWPEIGLEIS